MQKQNTLSLCYNRLILMTAVVLCGLLSVFWCHLPVHAATKDANGYTVATDLSGQAYAVFCEDNTTLYLLRDKTTGRAIGSSYTVTDTDGSTHSGVVTQNDLESSSGGGYGDSASWLTNKDTATAGKITSVKCLGDIQPVTTCNWFYDFLSASSIDLSKLDASKVTDMYNMFPNCSQLTSLDVSGFDTSKVTNMGSMFSGCKQLTSLDVSGFDTSRVMNMRRMFYSCSQLTSLDVSGFDTSKVTNMNYMFSDCKQLATLDVSGFDTSKVTDMGGMFYGCKQLTSLDVSGFDTSRVTNMCQMFFYCPRLTTLDVSGFDTSKVTNMREMFLGCSSLTTLDVSNFDTSKVTNMSHMFFGCSGLTLLDVSELDTSNVTDMNYMFDNCSKLTSIRLGTKTVLSSGCRLPTPSDTSRFTGKWTLSDPYNHSGQLSSSELITKTQEAGGAPGLWVAERTGADPKIQGYTSISSNIYDAALHTNPDGTVKSGEDPASLFRTEEGGSGYWQKLADNRWAYTFFVYKNDEVNWRVWEDGVSGYTGNYTIINPLDIAGSDIQKGDQPVITNTKVNAPKTGSLSLTKKTVSSDGGALSTDQAFAFTITLTGDNISGAQVFGDTPFVDGKATVSLKNGENITFTDIPAGTSYQISEAQTEGFSGSIDKPSGTVPYNGSVAVVCTNTKQDKTKDYVSFTVTKKVISNADESGTRFSFHVSFTGLEINTTYQMSDGTSFSSDQDGNANADFQLSDKQSVTFRNIPAGAKYTVTEDGGEYLPSYKITDSTGVNKIVSSSGKSVQTGTALSTSKETADKGENVQITFTNEITRTQDIVLTKSSVKADGSADTGDTNQYLVDVYISGLSGRQKIKTSNGILTADDDGIIETGMYISAGQKIVFFDVPVGARYKFTEEANSKIPSYKLTDTSVGTDLTGYKSVSEITGDTAKRLDGMQSSSTVSQQMTKHAHTANVSDDGTSSENYNNNTNYSSTTTATVDGKTVSENLQTVTIPGADSISVDVTYQTESTSYDWLYIYKGTVTRSSAADSGTAGTLAKSSKIGGSTKTTLDTITVPGDTVTFVWRTDGSGNSYYGYYATVSGISKQQTPVSITRTDSGIRTTKNGTSADYMFMKASAAVQDSKANIRLDFYDDPEGSPVDTVYLDTSITEAQYNAMDAATRDDTVLKSLSAKSTASIVSTSKANTEANTSLSTAEETVDAGENITVAFTNTSPKAAKLKVIKYDNSTSKKKLAGAEFALFRADGTPVNYTADGTNLITIGSSGESALLESPLFTEGSYYLTETKAPDGYTVSGEPKVFQITADDAGKTLQIEVYDNKLVVFPVTGGEGNRRTLSIALVLAAAAGSALIYKKRRESAA